MSHNNQNKYKDMINFPHHTSATHPRMSIISRAAQFAPFAALTGYEEAAAETARLTERKPELDEDEKEILDRKIKHIQEHLENQPQVTITYFIQDEKKAGGSFRTMTGRVKKINSFEHTIIMQNGELVSIPDIVDIQLRFTP